jgi:hypothetical protein
MKATTWHIADVAPPAFLAALGAEAALAADAPKLIRSAQSGRWSAATTWEDGQVPTAGARVQVRGGHSIVYDLKSDQVIRSIHVAGKLTFDGTRDTKLVVGLIKIQSGEDASEEGFDCDAHLPRKTNEDRRNAVLQVGTPARPIGPEHTALIQLTYVAGLDKQSCPAIVCCGGRMDFHGAPLSRTWVKLGATAKAGSTGVMLAESVSGWRAGDRIIVTATKRDGRGVKSSTEERFVKSLTGPQLTLDKPLEHDHLGAGDYRGEVANLSRTVVVESADPQGERGHTMYHRGSAGAISYAEFRHLGKPGVLGRYSLHYHLVGNSMRGSSVIGASIWDSGNRWLTIHGTNALVVRDCVGWGSVGHGFFLEDGTEIGNVLDRNLAVGARRGKPLPKQVLPFDANDGAGFWWANSLNTFTRNVAADNGLYGFRFEATPTSALKLVFPIQQPDGSTKPTDIRTLPFIRFEGNEVHSSSGLYGVNLGEGVDRVGPDTRHPFVVRDLKIWDVHYAFRPQVPSLLAEHVRIWRAEYGVYHPNYDNHVYRDLVIAETNTEPFNRGHDDLSIQYGVLAVDGLTFDGIYSGDQMPLIQISDDNPTGAAVSHFRNVKLTNWRGSKGRAVVNLGGGPRPDPKTPKGVPIYVHDWFGPGRHAMVVSTRSPEFKAEQSRFKNVPLFTGDESRAAEVTGTAFPRLLEPVDDMPPISVITHVSRQPSGQLLVRGTTSDNGVVKTVWVNDREAKSLRDGFAEWEIVLDSNGASAVQLIAHAIDTAGNREIKGHVMTVNPLD